MLLRAIARKNLIAVLSFRSSTIFSKQSFNAIYVFFFFYRKPAFSERKVRSDRVRSDQVRSDQIRNDRVISDRVRSDRVRNDRVRSDRVRSDRVRISDVPDSLSGSGSGRILI